MISLDVHFEVTSPAGKQVVTLAGLGPHWIGRDAECAITLPAGNISRRHASVEIVSDGIRVTDTSSNGLLVNNDLLHRTSRIVASDSVTMSAGMFEIRVWHNLSGRGIGKHRVVEFRGPAPKRVVVAEATARSDCDADSVESPSGGPIPPNAEKHSFEAAPSATQRRQIHRKLLEYMNLPARDRLRSDSDKLRPEVVAALRRIVADCTEFTLSRTAQESLVQELADEALGLGPLERFLSDPTVNEIMVVDPETIFVEREGKMQLTGCRFTDDDSVRAAIERIVTPLGRRIDESTPLVDARLKDGSRVNAIIPPLALRGPCITIRKFAKEPLRMADLIRFGSVSEQVARFLERSVKARRNVVISGGTGSGKTTLLNVLSCSIPTRERIVTVEDAAELRLSQSHVVSLEARPPNLEGRGEYSIRDLVKNALRMRPDRIVVGECRGGEAIDMLQAMNTGHEGSLTTTHANSPREAVARIETLCLMAGLDLPVRAIRQQIATSIHIIVQQTRFSDGSRRVTRVSEVTGLSDDGDVELRDIFEYKCGSGAAGGPVRGEFLATGYLPSFLDRFITLGLIEDGAYL